MCKKWSCWWNTNVSLVYWLTLYVKPDIYPRLIYASFFHYWHDMGLTVHFNCPASIIVLLLLIKDNIAQWLQLSAANDSNSSRRGNRGQPQYYYFMMSDQRTDTQTLSGFDRILITGTIQCIYSTQKNRLIHNQMPWLIAVEQEIFIGTNSVIQYITE